MLLASTILVVGCGSSKSTSSSPSANASTTTTEPAATATVPANTGSQTSAQSTGSTGPTTTTSAPAATTPASKAGQPTPDKSAPKPKAKVKPRYVEGRIAPEPTKGIRHQFPFELKQKFIEVWLSAGGSKATAECVIEKYEERSVSEGKALAEMVGFQLALLNHLPLNALSRQYNRECHGTVSLTRRPT